jgi:DNA polymerase-3 subunit gamma/tau
MSYLVLARKWRPQRFDEIVGQRHVALTLGNALRTDRVSHAYLFAGPRGVGKTSMARILAKALNCEKGPAAEPCNACPACRAITEGHCLDVLEIDGASNRGIDDVRQLREGVKYAPASTRAKVYIIDEVHMLTADAFNALLKTLEEPPRHVYFVLATTEPLRVPPTILSRCQRHDFGRLTVDELAGNLRKIVDAEKIAIHQDALRLIARKGEGSVRDTLTLLDQVAATGAGPFGEGEIQEILGLSGTGLYFELSDAVVAADGKRALLTLEQAYEQGLNLQELADELVHHFRDLLVASLGEEMERLVEGTGEERARLREQAARVRPGDALRWLRILLDVAARMRRSPHGRVHLEVALAEMASLPRAVDLAEVLERLRAGETAVASAPVSSAAVPARERGGAAPASAASGEAPVAPAAPAGDPELAPRWEQVIARVRQEKAFLGSCLLESRVLSIAEGRLVVQLSDTNGFKKEQIEKPANRRYLLVVIEEVFGQSLGLRLADASAAVATGAAAPAGPAAPPAPAAAEPKTAAAKPREKGRERVKRIAELLDGDIIGPAQ